MKRGTFVGAFLIACMAGISRDTAAQQRPSLTVQATLGPVYGQTAGEYRSDRHATAIDLLLGVRAGSADRHGLVLGASATRPYAEVHTDQCFPATTGDGCIPPFPSFGVVGALLGWENASSTLRVMGGPAWAHAEADALAWQARLDASLPVVWRLGLAGSVRGTVVPSYQGDAIRLFGLGLGVRIR